MRKYSFLLIIVVVCFIGATAKYSCKASSMHQDRIQEIIIDQDILDEIERLNILEASDPPVPIDDYEYLAPVAPDPVVSVESSVPVENEPSSKFRRRTPVRTFIKRLLNL